jgi:pyridoxamine 5'-phosphate oxidase
MNQKKSLRLDACFLDLDNPLVLFKKWMSEAKKTEINDPNALSLGTSNKKNAPNVRIVLLKGLSSKGFVFYTNLDSAKSIELKQNSKAAMCFHWKSLLRQIRIFGKVSMVNDKEADKYYKTRSYGSKIGAWASQQSSVLRDRSELFYRVEKFKKKYNNLSNIPRPPYWSGWRLKPSSLEFWLDGKDRIHQRLKYTKRRNIWKKEILYP